MNREALIKRAKEILSEAQEEVAELIVEFLDAHPSEKLQLLCKEIDPDNWNALRRKVYRALEARKSSPDAEPGRARRQRVVRAARQALRDPDQRKSTLDSLTKTERADLMEDLIALEGGEAIPPPPTPRASDPSEYEIDHLLLRASGPLQQSADRIEKYGVRTMRPIEDVQDTMTGIVTNVATIAAAINEKEESNV